ncbi:MAG: hypothetical protein A4E23_00016 [Methanomethylovorans sp. PtaU1.Bin073]|nr:MAG: hypothetical protein A4E23_00016 [Methanomethylovorans sp. PtaU1.Bin073]
MKYGNNEKISAILQMEVLSLITTIIAAHINLAKPLRSEVCHKSITIDTA